MNNSSIVTKKSLPVRLFTFTLPVLMVGMLQVGGCMRGTSAPPPPGGTYLSTDGGVTFEQKVERVDDEEEEGAHIARASLSEAHRPAHDPTSIYIAAAEQGIVVSQDNGKTWRIVSTPLVSTVNVVVLPDDTWVASGTGEDGQGYVIRSQDKGEEWKIALTVPLPQERRQLQLLRSTSGEASVVLSIAQDPFNSGRVYAGSNLGTVFVGERSAEAWRTLHTLDSDSLLSGPTQQIPAIQKIIPSPHQPNDFLLLTRTRNLIRVTGNEQQMIEVPRNLEEENTFLGSSGNLRIYDAKFIPGFPDAILVGANNGVLLTRDRGATWSKLKVPIDESLDFNQVTVTTSPVNPNRFFVSFNNVLYRSEDAGHTWITFSLGALGVPGMITDISIDPTNEDNILVVTSPVTI